MNPFTIRVSQYQTAIPRRHDDKPQSKSRVRFRWRAEFEAAKGQSAVADGCMSPDQAIGLLVRSQCQLELGDVARPATLVDNVLNVVAALFGDLSVRSADEQLGRAIRLAARSPRRLNPGCRVEIDDAMVLVAQKGGVA